MALMHRLLALMLVLGGTARAETLWQQQNGVWTARCENEPFLHCEAFSTEKERDHDFSSLTITYVVSYDKKDGSGKAKLYGNIPWRETRIFMSRDYGGQPTHHWSPLGCEKGTPDPKTCVLNINVGAIGFMAGGTPDTEFQLVWNNTPHNFHFKRDGSPETFRALIEAVNKHLR